MKFPKANWPTVLNIAKSLLAVESFYIQTCNLMKCLLLPLPFVDPPEDLEETPKPKYVFHAILEFICSRVNQIIENDSLSTLSLEAISEILTYFKEKQIKEHKENLKLINKSNKINLLHKVAEIEYKVLNMSELNLENQKKQVYYNNKRKSTASFDPGPTKRTNFLVEEPSTQYCYTDLRENYDEKLMISKEEIKSQCLPICSIPPNLLAKCKNQPPSSSLFLYNLPKKINEEEILKLLSYVFPSNRIDKNNIKIEILKGRLKGQGFLHFDSIQTASEIRDTLFGFPLQGKPLILVRHI